MASPTDAECPQPLRYRVLRAGRWVAAGFLLDKLIATSQLVILVRLLMPADFGLMAASASILLALLVVGELGLSQTLTVRDQVSDDDLAVAWTLSIVRGLLLALFLWIFAGVIASLMRMEQLEGLLRVHALALPIQGMQSPALVLLARRLDLKKQVGIDIVRRATEGVAVVLLAFWFRNVWALLLGQLIGFFAGSALSYRVAPFRPRLSLNAGSLRHFVKYGKHVHARTILVFVVMGGGELIIGRMLGAEALGIYQIALVIPMLVGARISGMLESISFPTYALLRSDRAGMLRAFALQLGLVSAVLVPAVACLAIMAPTVVAILFGSRWLETIEPLRILCVYAVCAGISSVMMALHLGLEHPDIQMRIWRVLGPLYLILVIPLIKGFGIAGACAALAFCYFVGLLLHVRYTISLLGREARGAFFALWRLILFVGMIASGLLLLPNLQSGSSGQWLLTLYGFGALLAWGLYLWRTEYPRLRELWEFSPSDTR